MADELRIHLLGGLRIAIGGVRVSDFMSNKAPALLAYLAVTGRAVRRDDLAALLWGEMPDVDARNNLRQIIANLKRLLDPYLIITRETVELNLSAGLSAGPDASYFLDVATFERGLQPPPALSPIRPFTPTPDLPGVDAPELQDAAALYTGDFLAGFFVREAPAFEEWMLAQRARYRELALNALHTLTQLHLDAGRYDVAISDATRLLLLDEWREETHRQLMLALARTGQRTAALAQYKRCQRLLRQEFAVEPSSETTELYARIKAALATPRRKPPVSPVDLIGRDDTLHEIRRLLLSPTCRLLTLIGLGGVGKTALALNTAANLSDSFLDGVWVAQLAAVTAPDGLIATIAGALGFVFTGAEPLGPQLIDYLRRKELLLVLDNFEHLSAPTSLRLLSQLLAHAPGLKLLVTSRVRLNLAAEWLFDVAGLPCSVDNDPGGATCGPAVHLFVQRAGRVRPGFRLSAENASAIAAICQMTEGLPLGIELAAAWSRAMPPEEIAAEIRRSLTFLASTAFDMTERHRSLVVVFEHSWMLLDPASQQTLAQLSVFRGGFDGAAAEAVAGASRVMLQSLVDQSLLRSFEDGRFELHPLVREFSGERLPQWPGLMRDQALERHARHFAALTLRHEHEFHESFLYFFDIQGRYQECVEMTGEALRGLQAHSEGGAAGAHQRGLGRLQALHAGFQFRVGAFDLARQHAADAMALLEPLEPLRDVGHARLYLGAAWYGLGHLGLATHWFMAAAEAYATVGHTWGIGAALDNAGFLELLRGNVGTAESHLLRALDIAQQTGSRYLLTGVSDHLATLTAAQRRFDEAMRYVNQCRAVLIGFDRPYIKASLSLSLSQIAAQAGELAAAEEHLNRSLDIARATGNRFDIANALVRNGQIQIARGNRAGAARTLSEAAAIGREIRAESLLVDVVSALADLASAAGRRQVAVALCRLVCGHAAASKETLRHSLDHLRRIDGDLSAPDAPGFPTSLDEALGLGLSEARA